MINRYVEVVITRQTKPVTQKGFGVSAVISDDKVAPYQEFTGVELVGELYGVESNTYKLASRIFGQTPRPQKIGIMGIAAADETGLAPAEYVAAANTLSKSHGDFFYLHCTNQSDAVITALSEWGTTQKRFYFASTANKTLHATLRSNQTVLLVHDTPEQYPAAAWVGVCSPQAIGLYTWTFKTLNGVIPSDYDETELGDIEKGASAYIHHGGVDITSKGITTAGEYIDVIQSEFFLQSKLTEAIYALLARHPKIPFTYAGIGLVVTAMDGVFKRCATDAQPIIARDKDGNAEYKIFPPSVEDISENDRADRMLPDIPWELRLGGGIEKVRISGVLKV